MNTFINADCLEVMSQYPDDYFDLAIVDPPYFSGPEKRKFYGRKISPIGVQRLYGQMLLQWKMGMRVGNAMMCLTACLLHK